ncbi:MAG: IS630 family transposase [Desulfamplus sp.]|nr:IS630 family transposase [Desulfamplus sp.]
MNKTYSTHDVRLRAAIAIEAGLPVISVAQAYQVHRATAYRWWERYKSEGNDGLTRKKGSGRPRIFEQLSECDLTELVLCSALDFGYESDLWTCGRIKDTIYSKYSMDLSRWTIMRRLHDASLTYQKPERRYINASEEERSNWKKYTVPKIRREVKKYGAILYFQDEANISLTAFLGKTWAPKGSTPTQEVTGKRGGVSAMSAISGIGRLIFKLHDKRIASDEVIDFLKQMLRHHKNRHLVVVMDQAPPHTSKKTKKYIESQKRLHVFHLPKYSPDWNPDEKLWNHLKTQELKGHRAKSKEELRALAEEKLTQLENSPHKLRGIFFRCCVADLLH